MIAYGSSKRRVLMTVQLICILDPIHRTSFVDSYSCYSFSCPSSTDANVFERLLSAETEVTIPHPQKEVCAESKRPVMKSLRIHGNDTSCPQKQQQPVEIEMKCTFPRIFIPSVISRQTHAREISLPKENESPTENKERLVLSQYFCIKNPWKTHTKTIARVR